jgi:hypothetical protein
MQPTSLSRYGFILIVGLILITTVTADYIHPMNKSSSYIIQWQKNYGSDWSGGRYQGAQPIGDCDNDGQNELLIAGRDGRIDVMKWDEGMQTYEIAAVLHSPFYPLFLVRQYIAERFFNEQLPPPNAGGFAIGDITGDGQNEIAATWYGAVYKYIAGEYRLIGLNSWVFRNNGGSGDCFIGDCDNDGLNELIISGGGGTLENPVPEIVILKWNGYRLEKVATYDDPAHGYAFMAGLGDTNGDGENEIAVGITNYGNRPDDMNRFLVLKWNKQTQSFDETVLYTTKGWDGAPFGGWCADSTGNGIDEIHFGYASPRISIFGWDGESYTMIFDRTWPGEGMLIEAINIGDVDGDGFVEVCAGTDKVHILQWNGTTYVEEAVINETYGDLAVLNIGDCDNDGKNEIHVSPVFVKHGEDYIAWVFKYN